MLYIQFLSGIQHAITFCSRNDKSSIMTQPSIALRRCSQIMELKCTHLVDINTSMVKSGFLHKTPCLEDETLIPKRSMCTIAHRLFPWSLSYLLKHCLVQPKLLLVLLLVQLRLLLKSVAFRGHPQQLRLQFTNLLVQTFEIDQSARRV